MLRLFHSLLLCSVLLLAQTAHASCKSTGAVRAGDHDAVPIPLGHINLIHPSDLQPAGTLLASTVVTAINYPNKKGKAGETVVWKCDQSDAGEIYFLVATNGDSRFGGHNEIGQHDGLVDVYGTWFRHVGLRLSMEGVNLTRYWKRLPVPRPYHIGDDNKIHIRLQDIPPLQVELYRVSQNVPNKGNKYSCSADGGYQRPSDIAGILYSCNQPASYIQLHGPSLKSDEENEDSDTRYDFFPGLRGLVWV